MQDTTARGSRQSMPPTILLRFMANTQPGGAGVSKNDKKNHHISRPISIQYAIQKLKCVCFFFKHTAVLVWSSPAVVAKAKKRQKMTKNLGKKVIQFYRPPPRKMP